MKSLSSVNKVGDEIPEQCQQGGDEIPEQCQQGGR